MNLFDAGAVILLVVAAVLGYRSGALPQIGGLLGAVGGGATAIVALPIAEGFLEGFAPALRAIGVVVWLLLAIGLGETAGSAIGRAAAGQLGRGLLGSVDRIAGAFVGAGQAILIIWLAGGLLAAGPLPRLSNQAQSAATVRAIARFLPPPTEMAVGLGRLLDASGLPDVFIGLEPVPAPPVDRPADAAAQAIARVAERSTVKVSSQTCGVISTGTGFAIARDYVVTNAHVVAGSRTVRATLGSSAHDASTVLFDPDLDIALLWVPNLGATPLDFAGRDPGRDEKAAAIGFPGGGAMTVIPAAVAGRYDAQGLDIYGKKRVARTILELRADIQRGDSGGPLVLVDGTIGGIVFAESRSEPDVGYALAPTPVVRRVSPAIGNQSVVSTGKCIR